MRLPADCAGRGAGADAAARRRAAEAEYLVFEHGPFDYETAECRTVEAKIEQAMRHFDYAATGYCYDDAPGRILYFYFDPGRFWKYVRPVRKCEG